MGDRLHRRSRAAPGDPDPRLTTSHNSSVAPRLAGACEEIGCGSSEVSDPRSLAHRRRLIGSTGTSAGRRSPVEPCEWAGPSRQRRLIGGSGLRLRRRLIPALDRPSRGGAGRAGTLRCREQPLVNRSLPILFSPPRQSGSRHPPARIGHVRRVQRGTSSSLYAWEDRPGSRASTGHALRATAPA